MKKLPLAHRSEGHGPPVLLLNGVMMSALAWQPVVAVMRPRCRVITCDFRGQLLTPGPAHSDLRDNAADIAALLDELAIDRVVVAGTSFGGAAGAAFAARHPERVRGLVVIAAAAHADEHLLAFEKSWRALALAAAQGGARRPLFEQVFADAYSERFRRENHADIESKLEQLEAMPQAFFDGLLQLFDAARDLDLRGDLARIAAPALVIAAGEDRVILSEATRAFADGIAGSAYEVIPRAGHAVALERPVEVAARLLRFIERCG